MDNVVFINNSDYSKIMISFVFNNKYIESDLGLRSFINRLLLKNNKDIKDEEDFTNELIKHSILSKDVFSQKVCDNCYTFIDITLPDPALYKYDIKDSLEFIIYSIYNPYFKEEDIIKIKKKIKNGIDNISLDINSYANFRIEEIIDDPLMTLNLDHHPLALEKIDMFKIKEYFDKYIKSFNPKIYVMGNNVTSYKEIFESSFDENKNNPVINKNEIRKVIYEKDKIVRDKEKFEQSSVNMIYKIKDYTKDDIPLFNLFLLLLNSSACRLLYTTMRIENSFVYTTGALGMPSRGLCKIKMLLHKENINAAIEETKKLLKRMQDEEFIAPLIEKALAKEELDMINDKDYMSGLFNQVIFEDLGIRKTCENEYKILKKLTAKDIKKFIDRLSLMLTYIIEGDLSE